MNRKLKYTTSLGVAAALLSKGAVLEDINKSDPRHMVFGFSDGSASPDNTAVDAAISSNNLDVWEKAWANETLEVNAVKFMNALNRLKSVIHSV